MTAHHTEEVGTGDKTGLVMVPSGNCLANHSMAQACPVHARPDIIFGAGKGCCCMMLHCISSMPFASSDTGGMLGKRTCSPSTGLP